MIDESDSMPREDVVRLLQRSFAMRAASYAHFYDVLAEELGAERALELGKRATRRMGETMGKAFEHLGPSDLGGLKDAFLGGIIEGDTLFAPEVVQVDEEALRINFHRCPLKEAWQAMGRSENDLHRLCEMAGAIDGGLFEAAGFTFAGETWQIGENGCCKLCVLPGPGAAEQS